MAYTNRTFSWDLDELNRFYNKYVRSLTGYYTCNTAAGTAAKTVTATWFNSTDGGSYKVKMTNANTAGNATLNINGTGAKPLIFDGVRASASNSWKAGDVLEVWTDGTSYYAKSFSGDAKFGSGEKVRDTDIDITPTKGSSGIAGSNGVWEFVEYYKKNDDLRNRTIVANDFYLTGGYSSDGSFSTATTRYLTDIVSVNAGDEFMVNLTNTASQMSVVAFDKDMDVIVSSCLVGTQQNVTYTVGSGVRFLRFEVQATGNKEVKRIGAVYNELDGGWYAS